MKSTSLFVFLFLGRSCPLSGFIVLADLDYLVGVFQVLSWRFSSFIHFHGSTYLRPF